MLQKNRRLDFDGGPVPIGIWSENEASAEIVRTFFLFWDCF